MSEQPFPIESLPPVVRSFVEAVANSMDCDPGFVAVPLLATAAAAIGASSEIELKVGWREPSTLWTAIVAPSGSGKTPAMQVATAPLMQAHLRSAAEHRNNPEVTPRRFVTADCTLEGLAVMLGQNPHGMLLARDELSGWLGAFDKYHNGKGSDVAGWLSLHSGAAVIVDRKRSESVLVPKPRLSICGTIQPAVLERCIAGHVDNGMAARLLLAKPPTAVRQWTENELSQAQTEAWKAAVERLLVLYTGDEPTICRFGVPAQELFVSWFNQHNAETSTLGNALKSHWRKLEAACARLALVVHLLEWATGNSGQAPSTTILRPSIERAISLVEYFKHEARTIYADWEASPMARELSKTLQQVQKMGGLCTVREYQRRLNCTTEEATSKLQQLVREEVATWQTVAPGPQGGRPTRQLVLNDRSTAGTLAQELN